MLGDYSSDQDMIGNIGSSIMDDGSGQPDSMFARAISALPSAKATMLWNANRVSNTLISGGKEYSRAMRKARHSTWFGRTGKSFEEAFNPAAGTGGFIKQGIGNTMRPSRFRRMTRAASIDSSAYEASAKMYSPFQLAGLGNSILEMNPQKLPIVGKYFSGKIGSRMAKTGEKISGKFGGAAEEGTPYFSSGTLGRIVAGSRVTNISDAKFSSDKFLGKRASIAHSLNDMSAGKTNFVAESLTREDARYGIINSIDSRIGGRAAGFLGTLAEYKGVGGGEAGFDAAAKFILTDKIKTEGAMEGGVKALQLAIKNPGMAKALGYAPEALGIASSFSNVLMAGAVGKMIGTGIGSAIKTGMNAARSVQGSLNKPVFGMGFKDNSVAATSRQRGVMAIQNSQLNARSILGNEASAIHAHFG